MSKISNTILMLKLLESGKIYKIKELAEMLECSPRAVRTYKEDLEKAGIYITTILGRYGGYVYKEKERLEYYAFNKFELRALENLFDYANDFLDINKTDINYLSSVIDKIRYYVIISNIDNDKRLGNDDIYEEYYKKISNAIYENKKLRFYYNKRKNTKLYRTLIPQNIYIYDRNYFVTGTVEELKEIRTFNFNSLKDLKII